ncbi:MAG: CoA-binding protein [Gemmatimonadota bacterium]|nr:MAG: CoA-binding protein [Gemmatimonadota bacterium]
MTTKASVDEFLALKTLAIVGVSRTGKKFGNAIYRDLKGKDYRIFRVHPEVETIEGEPCYPNLNMLPEEVGGVIIVVPPQETEKVVQDVALAGINKVWMQQGAESEEAIQFCNENGISVVRGECILMFAEPVGFLHRTQRWVWKLLGKLPK